MSNDLGTAGRKETRELAHSVTQQMVRSLQQHPPAPKQLPSMYELEELKPRVSDVTVDKHNQKLIDAGNTREATHKPNKMVKYENASCPGQQ